MNNYFKFKEFTINQDLTAMKVGTDGVLLGAWGAVGEGCILDVGCGTGLIAIMAAQRTKNLSRKIDAIDLDIDAATQAEQNKEACVWAKDISVHNTSIQDFKTEHKYDYILSNPPYFINSLTTPEEKRTLARHNNTLTQHDLALNVSRLLSDNGIFSVILPYVEANMFIVEAVKHSLYCIKRMDIKGSTGKAIKRVMLQFSKVKGEIQNEELTIELGERHLYSHKYKELTENFYLKF